MRYIVSIYISIVLIILLGTVLAVASQEVDIRSAIHNIGEKEVTWNSSDFPGFYYDLDNGIGTESLTFRLSNIDPDGASATLSDEPDANGNRGVVYTTNAQLTDFSFYQWGQYEEIRFLGGDYFAAYDGDITWGMNETNQIVPFLYDKSESRNLMADDMLSEILWDDDTEQTINSSQPLELEEGYKLAIKSIDADGKKAHVELSKNGQVVDSKVVQTSIENANINDGTYYYKRNLGDAKDIVTIAVHLKNAFSSVGNNIATVDGIFQISDTPLSLDADHRYDKMSFSEINSTALTIKMDNKDNKIILSSNKNITLMGKIHIQTADQDDTSAEDPLRYYIYSIESCEC